MGKIISLDYAAMKKACTKANKAAEQCDSYAKKVDSKIIQRVACLKLGNSSNTSQANYFARAKINSLNSKKNKYQIFASKVESARIYAEETDADVSAYIKSASRSFRASHDMKVGVITELFSWITTTVLNSTAFGRWLNQMSKDIGTWIDSAKRTFKKWWELDGGKYIVKAALAVIGTVIAVIVLVCVAWPALVSILVEISVAGLAGLTGGMIWTLVTTTAAFVTAVAAVTDGVVKSENRLAAALSFGDDPGWAKRYSSYTSLSEYLRKNNFKSSFLNKISETAANVVESITTAADMIQVSDLAQNGVRVLKDLKNGKLAKVINKVHFKSPNGKVTLGTIKYGAKNAIRNGGELKKLMTTTNASRLKEPFEAGLKQISFYKKLGAAQKYGKIIESVGDNGIVRTVGDKIKDKSKSYEYGSKVNDLIKKINPYSKDQKPKYQGLQNGVW